MSANAQQPANSDLSEDFSLRGHESHKKVHVEFSHGHGKYNPISGLHRKIHARAPVCVSVHVQTVIECSREMDQVLDAGNSYDLAQRSTISH